MHRNINKLAASCARGTIGFAVATALWAGCSADDTSLALRVSGIPPSASELRVHATIDGQPSTTVGSYAPPSGNQAELRLGVRLVGHSSGQATLSVAACNSACLLAQQSVTVDLAAGNSEPTVPLQSAAEKLDLSRCAPRAPILCNLQLERDASTGQVRFALEGSGFDGSSFVSADGTKIETPQLASPGRIEFAQLPTLTGAVSLMEVGLADRTSVLRRLPTLNLPLDSVPQTVEPAMPAPQLNRMPIVTAMHVADLDLDGHPDVVVAGVYFSTTQGEVSDSPGFLSIYWGDGKRGFARTPITTTLPAIPRSLTAASLRGGGLPQLVLGTGDYLQFGGKNYVTDVQPSGSVWFFDPTAPRTYGAPVEIKLGSRFSSVSPHQIAAMDIDRDGQLDLVIGLSNTRTLPVSFAGALAYWKGSGAGWQFSMLNPAALSTIILDVLKVSPLAFVPWDGVDGKKPGGLAVAVSKTANLIDYTGELWMFSNNGSGTLTVTSQVQTGGMALQLLPGDFNGDGRQDLLCTLPVGNDRKTALRRLALFTAADTAAAPTTLDLPAPLGLATTIDLFADRRDDLVLYAADTAGKRLAIMPTTTVAPYLPPAPFSLSPRDAGQTLLASGDLDGDGKRDLISVSVGTVDSVSPYSGQFDIYYGR